MIRLLRLLRVGRPFRELATPQTETPMTRRVLHLAAQVLWFCILPVSVFAQLPEPLPKLKYEAVADFFQLPSGEHFVEPAGVAVNSKGHIYVFHRGKHPLMEFDASGKFLRSIADDLFVTAHTVRVDSEDNIWTTDTGSHVVLKLNPEGQILLSLGECEQRAMMFTISINPPMWRSIAKEISMSRTAKVIRASSSLTSTATCCSA